MRLNNGKKEDYDGLKTANEMVGYCYILLPRNRYKYIHLTASLRFLMGTHIRNRSSFCVPGVVEVAYFTISFNF